jgi:hypothetical protein
MNDAPMNFARRGRYAAPLSLADAAVLYIRQGWTILPILSRTYTYIGIKKGKTPFVGIIMNPSMDHSRIHAWFSRHPQAGIGIITGSRSGLFVVDIDAGADPDLVGTLPPTRTCHTGNGKHLYYQLSPNTVVQTSIAVIHPSIDILGEDRIYAITAPSQHTNGKQYQWEDFDAPIAPIDDTLRQLLTRAHRRYILVNYTKPRIVLKRCINTYIRYLLAFFGK